MHIQEKNILTFVTLLKATVGLTWQIMPIIIRTDILNLSSISRISALEKYKKEKKKRKEKLN